MAFPIHANELNMEPGMWKWTSTMEIEAMQISVPPVSYSNCVTRQDLIPKHPEDNQACTVLNQEVTSDYVQWKLECEDNGDKTTANGKIYYNGTSANGEILMLSKGMKMTTKLKGQRTGDCK
ncbi:MAG: DUF3617 domain-containing protein [Gammaproteobacteria bacterium]|nr:DUF3617 domain-containing protein [Gammaproteobacteria bacterium]